MDDLGGLARVVEAHGGWIELLDQGFEGCIAVGEQGAVDVFVGAILGGEARSQWCGTFGPQRRCVDR